MDAEGVSRIRERVERFLAEDHPERLSDIHDSMRRHPELRSDLRSGRRLTKTQAGIDGSVENLIPVLHLRRARRGPRSAGNAAVPVLGDRLSVYARLVLTIVLAAASTSCVAEYESRTDRIPIRQTWTQRWHR